MPKENRQLPVRATDQTTSTEDAETINKKKATAAIFKYIIEADEDKQEEMGIVVNEDVRSTFMHAMASDSNIKLDDLGDAFSACSQWTVMWRYELQTTSSCHTVNPQ